MPSICNNLKYYYLALQFQNLRINRIRFFIYNRARFVILIFVITGAKLYKQMLSYINCIRLLILLQNVKYHYFKILSINNSPRVCDIISFCKCKYYRM